MLPRVPRLLVPLLGIFFLVYPIQGVLDAGPTPAQASVALGGAALFAGIFLWLMWTREPLQLVPAGPSEVLKIRAAIAFLAVLAGALGFGVGPEWRMLFFYHLNVAAGIMLPKREAYAVITGIALLTLVAGASTGLSWLAFPALAIGLWSTAFVGQVAAVAQLQAAREEIARLAVDEERLRFARDLHDLLGHSLSLITLKSTLAGRLLPVTPETERAADEVRGVEEVARGALREVREAVSDYRRPTLDAELASAQDILDAAGIDCRVECAAADLLPQTNAVLAWTVREGATNIIRHSQAQHCKIRVHQTGGETYVEISDDGIGASPSSSKDSNEAYGSPVASGLSGLAERVAASGGTFEAGPPINSPDDQGTPQSGFRVRVSLPPRDTSVPFDTAGEANGAADGEGNGKRQ